MLFVKKLLMHILVCDCKYFLLITLDCAMLEEDSFWLESKGASEMRVSYKKLWKMMIDIEMKKGELREKAQLSSSSMAKLANNKKVTLDVLMKVCEVLNCNLGDIAEFISDENSSNKQ